MVEANEAYIPKEDRPTGYDLDTPVGSLRVRDLATILNHLSPKIHVKLEGHSPLKEFFDKPFPEVLAPLERSAPVASTNVDQLVRSLTGLSDRVEELAAKVDELDRKLGR
jgi:hypothetical protein